MYLGGVDRSGDGSDEPSFTHAVSMSGTPVVSRCMAWHSMASNESWHDDGWAPASRSHSLPALIKSEERGSAGREKDEDGVLVLLNE